MGPVPGRVPGPVPGPDVAAFPTVSAYYDSLPDGWASFPECVARASLLGSLNERGALDVLEALPERLEPRVLLDHLAAGSEWLPEVVHVATLLAVRDVRFTAGPRGDEEFQRWLAQLNRDLLDQPENASAMEVGSSLEFVPRVAAVWMMFHAGTPAAVVTHSPTHAVLTVTHPLALFPELATESRRRACALALAKQGAVLPNVLARAEISGAEVRTIFDATWA